MAARDPEHVLPCQTTIGAERIARLQRQHTIAVDVECGKVLLRLKRACVVHVSVHACARVNLLLGHAELINNYYVVITNML